MTRARAQGGQTEAGARPSATPTPPAHTLQLQAALGDRVTTVALVPQVSQAGHTRRRRRSCISGRFPAALWSLRNYLEAPHVRQLARLPPRPQPALNYHVRPVSHVGVVCHGIVVS